MPNPITFTAASLTLNILSNFASDILKHQGQALDGTLAGNLLNKAGLIEPNFHDQVQDALKSAMKLYFDENPQYLISGILSFFSDSKTTEQISNHILNGMPIDHTKMREALKEHLSKRPLARSTIEGKGLNAETIVSDFLICYRRVLNKQLSVPHMAILLTVIELEQTVLQALHNSEVRVTRLLDTKLSPEALQAAYKEARQPKTAFNSWSIEPYQVELDQLGASSNYSSSLIAPSGEQEPSKRNIKAEHFYREWVGTQWLVRCVITQDRNPVYYCLDGQQKNHSFTNIIPISSNLKQAVENMTFHPLPFNLRPGTLAEKAREYFDPGNFPQGYACARLGAYLMLKRGVDVVPDPDKSLELCSYALIHLRPISALSLAIDTMTRSILPILQNGVVKHFVGKRTRAQLVIEIGSYFRDYGDVDMALQCCDIAASLLEGLPTITDERLRTRISQHRGITLAGKGDFLEADRWFQRARDMANATGYPQGTPNDMLWMARVNLAQPKPNPDLAKHLVKEVFEMEEKGIVPPWTMAEALWTEGDADLIYGQKKRSLEVVNLGIEFFRDAGIVPTAILPPHSLDKYYEKYPPNSELYVVPRQLMALREFTCLAKEVIKLVVV